MENCTDDNKKRARSEFDDSLTDSAESKLRRLNSLDLSIDLADSEELLLNILEDSDAVAEREESIQGVELDSFIRSFEEEIQALPPGKTTTSSSAAADENENESPQAELGYLFEASDDELGLPPTDGSRMEANDFMPACCSPGGVMEFEGNLGFEDEIPCYDSFEIGIGYASGAAAESSGLGGEFVALGGLFDYSDAPFRTESLSAL